MNCLQCHAPAEIGPDKVRTCAEGHRTVLLTKKEERAILKKIKEPINTGPLNVLIIESDKIKSNAAENKAAVNE